ncbi:hypothetical protein MKW92_010136 [Papaver armeniacum]|nr:hypothetical protein MKW92_010136 [Papaver armeniacum]
MKLFSWNSKENTYSFLQGRGAFGKPTKILDLLKIDRIEPGRIICSLICQPQSLWYTSWSAVATVAKLVAEACARTVVNEDMDLYLGELEYVVDGVDGSIVKSGRNVTTTSVEFRVKGTKKVALYCSRYLLYHSGFKIVKRYCNVAQKKKNHSLRH